MAISTYSELVAELEPWIDHDEADQRIPGYIALAEAQLNRRLRLAQMTHTSTATISTDNRYSSVPTDFLEARSFALVDGSRDYELTPATPAAIARYRADDNRTGRPRNWALTGTSSGRQFEFFPVPDAAYSVALTYYARIPALSDANPTNWLLDIAPDLYLYGSLLAADAFLRDGEAAVGWKALYEQGIEELKASNRTPGGRLRTEVAGMLRPHTYDFNTDS